MNKKGFIEVLIPVLIAMGALSGFLAYKYWFNPKDDNPVEELAEEVIKKETGFDIDLTPDSKEK